ncbi:MAG: sensor histidine kinase [Scytonematopsis contorta HA4267-MV1]|jgi:signal transduction histidine kinase|nr:sensor histidine kinase [Scytonematopsis contorta HA4267-MV1]
MEATDYETRLKELEKSVRILKKKLERSEADRLQLEKASEIREFTLKNVIQELEESQLSLEKRSQELETALINLKTLQVKLIESEKMSALGVLVAGIAHEINNPVSFIYGNLDHAKNYFDDLIRLLNLYQQHYPEPIAAIQKEIKVIELEFIKEDSEKLFQSMNMGAERICQIVKSLRTFSRLDEAEFKQVNIHDGIDSTLVILNNRLKPTSKNYKGIQIIRDYGNLPLVYCSPGQLNQVFINIIVNAIDALEEKNKQQIDNNNQESEPSQIHIQTEVINNEWALVRIADNALGMNEKVRSQLFDPFFTTKDIGKGTGLGLSITYQIIVELHSGKLECVSTLGTGTEFVIQIPILQKFCPKNTNA